MSPFWIATFTKPDIFWSFFQATATLLALIALIWDIVALRREVTSKKFSSLQSAYNIIHGDQFQNARKEFYESLKPTDQSDNTEVKYKQFITAIIFLESITTIAVMIKLTHLNKKLFLEMHGFHFGLIGKDLIPHIPSHYQGDYSKAIKLLSDAKQWREEKINKRNSE